MDLRFPRGVSAPGTSRNFCKGGTVVPNRNTVFSNACAHPARTRFAVSPKWHYVGSWYKALEVDIQPAPFPRSDMITGPQIRAARGLLGWSRAQLSRQSGVSASAIQRFENGRHDSRESTLAAIEAKLAESGVEFIGSIGVQLRADRVDQKTSVVRGGNRG